MTRSASYGPVYGPAVFGPVEFEWVCEECLEDCGGQCEEELAAADGDEWNRLNYPSYDPGFEFYEREGRPMFPNEY